MRVAKVLLGGVAVVVGLPLALTLIAIATITAFDRTNGSIVVSGEPREYLLHVPTTYERAKPIPLVISLHAGATWPAHQSNLSRWNHLADANGFIVVYPAGTPQLLGVVRAWHSFELGDGLERDVIFISELIDKLQAMYDIDLARIYVDGMSNGGGMAYVLACTLSDRIAAAGMVAAAQSLPKAWCKSKRPVPMIAFHGSADTIVPYDGGPLGDPFNPVKPIFAPVREFVASWATRNRCNANAIDSTVATRVTRREYPACAEGADVVLFTLEEGGHTWPGGKPMPTWRVGSTSNAVDATGEMWRFFQQHPLRATEGSSTTAAVANPELGS